MARWQDAPLEEAEGQQPRWASAPIESEPSRAPQKKDFGIDWMGEQGDVRAIVARLPAEEQDEAHRQWADALTAHEREKGFRPGASAARGIPFVGPLLDEAAGTASSIPYYVSGGAVGRPYSEEVELVRSRERAAHRDSPVGSFATELAGGLVTPMPFLKAGDSLLKTTAKVAGFSGAAGGAAGLGSEGDLEQRLEKGKEGAGVGLALGTALPPAAAAVGKGANIVYGAISPQVARAGAKLQEMRQNYGIRASADGGMPPNAGAQAAADQIMANQLYRAGKTTDDLNAVLAEAERASLYHGGGPRGTAGPSYAENVLAPVDLDRSLQRLGGSAVRQSPEAANIAGDFVAARQTGITPASGPIDARGIPTRPLLAKPAAGDKPMGQDERLFDAFRRALVIRDKDWHGHGANAYRTEQQIIQAAKDEAKVLYDDAYQAGGNIDIRPAIQPVMQKWADAITEEPLPVQNAIKSAITLFTSGKGNVVNSLERFDKSKQYLDGRIEKLFESVEGRNRYLGGVMSRFKGDLLAAVDDVKTGELGAKYAQARSAFGSQMEARDALRLGRDVWKADSDVGIDAFRSLQTPTEQKLFRLGLLDGYRLAASRMPRNADKTRLFDNPRIQEILGEVIPRTETATGRVKVGAEFGDRPERFGQYVGNEKRMVATKEEAFGNSKTAQRLADDQAFDDLNTIGSLFERVKSSPTLVAMGIKTVETIFSKFFGMRADTAEALARSLYTANPAQRYMILERVRRRMGDSRFQHFSRLMAEYQNSLAPATTTAGAAAGNQ